MAALKLAVAPIAKFRHVHGFAFSPDGKHFAALPAASPGRLFDTRDWKLVREFEKSGELGAAAFSPDGELIALAWMYLNLGVFRVSTGQPIWRSCVTKQWDQIKGLIVSLSTPEVIYANSGSRILIFDINSGEQTRELHLQKRKAMINAIALSPDGDCLAAAWNTTVDENKPFESMVTVWSWPEGRELRRLNFFGSSGERPYNADTICDICFGTSSERIAAINREGAVNLFDANTGECALEIRKHAGNSSGHVSISPNGHYCAVSNEGRLLLWDLDEKRLARDMLINQYGTNEAGFSLDSELLAITSSPRVFVFRVNDLLG